MGIHGAGVLWLAILTGANPGAFPEIVGSTPYKLDLTNAAEAGKAARWSDPEILSFTGEGLGWGTQADRGSRDFWLETQPIGIGESWRPASIATIKATTKMGATGLFYARYSADGKHWTTWQHIEEVGQLAGNKQVFQATLRVPYREQANYTARRMQYARRDDVPWSSDEEALAKAILVGDPTYFERTTPYIGYVQFLYETQLPGGHRLDGLEVNVGWDLGGKHQPPKDKKDYQGRSVPWRFKAAVTWREGDLGYVPLDCRLDGKAKAVFSGSRCFREAVGYMAHDGVRWAAQPAALHVDVALIVDIIDGDER